MTLNTDKLDQKAAHENAQELKKKQGENLAKDLVLAHKNKFIEKYTKITNGRKKIGNYNIDLRFEKGHPVNYHINNESVKFIPFKAFIELGNNTKKLTLIISDRTKYSEVNEDNISYNYDYNLHGELSSFNINELEKIIQKLVDSM